MFRLDWYNSCRWGQLLNASWWPLLGHWQCWEAPRFWGRSLVEILRLFVNILKLKFDQDLTQGPKRLKTPKKFTGSKIGAIFWQITSRVTTKKLKIGQRGNFEKIKFFPPFLMRKRLSSGQKWFLRPYFPLIRGMFLLRSGLRVLIWALEVPEARVRKMPLSL